MSSSFLNHKAVFFDVGGTLLRVHPSVGEVYTQHARPFGFTGSPGELDHKFRDEWKKMGGMESLGKSSGEAVEKKFWNDLVFKVFQGSGGLTDFEEFFERVYEAFKDKKHWRVFEDVVDSGILDILKRRGIVMGVVSNWDSRLPLILENMGIARYFKFILASTVVGSAKPDSLIFQQAIQLSGVAPEDACHIGDELQSDYHGARNAGLNAILIDRTGNHGDDIAPKISSFHELVEA